MKSFTANEIEKWVPWKLIKYESQTLCKWLYTGNKRFTEPFFDETISACRILEANNHSFNSVSDLQMMEQWSAEIEDVIPSAFIFHLSRCGSTLLSQQLSLDEKNIVLSEVPFFDELLRLGFSNDLIDVNAINNFLKAAIKFYGRKITGNESHIFIKTDSWHLHFYNQLRFAFPSVPFIILYRDPWDVILSQQRKKGMHAVPGLIDPEIFGFSKSDIENPDFESYLVKVLSGYFQKIIGIAKTDPKVLLVNYQEGFEAILEKVYNQLGLTISRDMQILVDERIRYHAKNPQQLFREENIRIAPPENLKDLLSLYKSVEELRLANFTAD